MKTKSKTSSKKSQPSMPKTNKVVKVKTYTITLTELENGIVNLNRRSDGFTGHELLGLLELSQLEIVAQLKGLIKPDVIKREVVE